MRRDATTHLSHSLHHRQLNTGSTKSAKQARRKCRRIWRRERFCPQSHTTVTTVATSHTSPAESNATSHRFAISVLREDLPKGCSLCSTKKSFTVTPYMSASVLSTTTSGIPSHVPTCSQPCRSSLFVVQVVAV